MSSYQVRLPATPPEEEAKSRSQQPPEHAQSVHVQPQRSRRLSTTNSAEVAKQKMVTNQIKANQKIMDQIIDKYKPKKKVRDLSKTAKATTEAYLESQDNGLEQIAEHLTTLSHGRLDLVDVKAPQKKLYVMIIGNHSAGKSSFINWYIGDQVQKTRVSIETIEINMIMHGANHQELSGHNVLKTLPFMEDLYDRKTREERFPGLLDNMTVKTSPSKLRYFDQIVFIDTPGLADGGLSYNFDVDEVYQWFAKHCDLVAVFLDPIGQALCQKTNLLIGKLIKQTRCDVKFYMTKGDMFKSEEDRMKCMCQIVQSLSAYAPARIGFEMPIIYLPEEANMYFKNKQLPNNQLSELTELIQRKLILKAQNNLARYKQDVQTLQNGVTTLQREQIELQSKPVQQILAGCQFALHVSICLCIASLIDIFTSDWIEESHDKIRKSEAALSIVMSLVFKVFTVVTKFCEAMLIHDNNYQVFFFTLLLMPVLIYVIQQIPIKYTVFSPQTQAKLDQYAYSLDFLKLGYDKLTKEMSKAALSQTATDAVQRSVNQVMTQMANPMAEFNWTTMPNVQRPPQNTATQSVRRPTAVGSAQDGGTQVSRTTVNGGSTAPLF